MGLLTITNMRKSQTTLLLLLLYTRVFELVETEMRKNDPSLTKYSSKLVMRIGNKISPASFCYNRIKRFTFCNCNFFKFICL